MKYFQPIHKGSKVQEVFEKQPELQLDWKEAKNQEGQNHKAGKGERRPKIKGWPKQKKAKMQVSFILLFGILLFFQVRKRLGLICRKYCRQSHHIFEKQGTQCTYTRLLHTVCSSAAYRFLKFQKLRFFFFLMKILHKEHFSIIDHLGESEFNGHFFGKGNLIWVRNKR